MLTQEDIKAINDIVNNAIKAHLNGSTPSQALSMETRITIQKERCRLDHLAYIEEDCKALKELETTSTVVDDEDYQDILDAFHFKQCAEMIDKVCPFNKFSEDELIEAALKAYDYMKDKDSGVYRLGRIALHKHIDQVNSTERWYSLSCVFEEQTSQK